MGTADVIGTVIVGSLVFAVLTTAQCIRWFLRGLQNGNVDRDEGPRPQ